MRRFSVIVLLAGALALAAPTTAPAASPIHSFAPSSCYHTVFAHTSGTQYGFTSCTGSHRIWLITGDGSSWRRVKLSIYGKPLAAADNGNLTYLLFESKGTLTIGWVGRAAAGVGGYVLQSLGGTIYSGGVVATKSGWRAAWSESFAGDVWECCGNFGPIVVNHDRAQYLSMAVVNGRVVVSWVAGGQLYVGTSSSTSMTRHKVTSDSVGQPRVLSYKGHAAIAFPDYTTNTARLAVSQNGVWTFTTLGSLDTNHASLMSAGWAGQAAVVAWQTPNGLQVARFVHGSWHKALLAGNANKVLAYSGSAVMHSDGSALLLGRQTSRVVG